MAAVSSVRVFIKPGPVTGGTGFAMNLSVRSAKGGKGWLVQGRSDQHGLDVNAVVNSGSMKLPAICFVMDWPVSHLLSLEKPLQLQ